MDHIVVPKNCYSKCLMYLHINVFELLEVKLLYLKFESQCRHQQLLLQLNVSEHRNLKDVQSIYQKYG